MRSNNNTELRGKTVVVTRARAQAAEMIELLQARGATVLVFPVIEVVPIEDVQLDPRGCDAILLGSKNAAELFFDRVSAVELPIACVGAKTAAYVATRTSAPIWIPDEYRAEAMIPMLRERLGSLEGRRFLFPRAPEGREVLIDLLTEAGAIVDAVSVYRIQTAPPPSEKDRAALASADIYTFASGETLRAFLDLVPGAPELLASKTVAVIGPVAAAKADSLGIRVDVMPKTATLEALVEAIAAHLV